MASLASIEGNWDLVTLSQEDSGEWVPDPSLSVHDWSFGRILNGTMIEGRGVVSLPWGLTLDGIMVLSFDQWNREYRAALMGSAYGLMDIYAGVWSDGGELVLSNAETGSAQSTSTQETLGQVRIVIESEDRFLMKLAQSFDAGATWNDLLIWEFSRRDR